MGKYLWIWANKGSKWQNYWLRLVLFQTLPETEIAYSRLTIHDLCENPLSPGFRPPGQKWLPLFWVIGLVSWVYLVNFWNKLLNWAIWMVYRDLSRPSKMWCWCINWLGFIAYFCWHLYLLSPFVAEHSCLLSADFKKEDVAWTLLYTMCQELVSTALYACHVTRIKHIFIGGSFIAHALTQRLVMEEFEYWKLIKATEGNVVSGQVFQNFCRLSPQPVAYPVHWSCDAIYES